MSQENTDSGYLNKLTKYSGLGIIYDYFSNKKEERDNYYMLGSEFQPTFPEGALKHFHERTQEILASREERKKSGSK